MKRIYSFIFPSILVLLTGILCALNYTPGTFLTGWDTLHPEFNFPRQFSNIFYGVFRADQGLGAIAAHSHMAELPRLLLLWASSFILPLSFLRYFYIFLCLILGPLGVYFFIKKISNSKPLISYSAAFLGALFYLFNLGTVQHFIVPFEMFTTQFAALGWLFLTAVLVLEKLSTKRLLLFSLVSFLAAPMAYAAVLWYAYFAGLLLFISTVFIVKRNKKTLFSVLSILGSVLATNAFWLFPNWYFLLTAAKDVSLAQTNRLFSDEAFLHNKAYGNLLDTIIFKNFLFNWSVQVDLTTTRDLMGAWRQHLAHPFVLISGYFVFTISLLGIILSIIKKRTYYIALLPVFIMALIAIMNMNPPFEFLFSFLRDNFSLFKEGLRFPFTKFSLLLMFTASIYFALTVEIFLTFMKRFKFLPHRIFLFIFLILTSTLFVLYCLPMFSGNLIDRSMRISIPEKYFQMFEFLNTQPENARVAPLPIHSLWGWEYYEWPQAQRASGPAMGYQGAGFLWFGINQPVLSRDFDRWNPSNEQYFREMSNAIYSRDPKLVEALAQKYNIRFFILDESIVFPGNKQNALWHYETKTTFEKSQRIKKIKDFGETLLVYEYEGMKDVGSEVTSPKTFGSVGPHLTGGFIDSASRLFPHYIEEENPLLFFPTRTFVNRYNRIDPRNITIQDGVLTLKLSDQIPSSYTLTSDWLRDEIFPQFMHDLHYDLDYETLSLPYRIGSDLFIPVASVSAVQPIENIIIQSQECGEIGPNSASEFTTTGGIVTLTAKNGSSCAYVNFPEGQQDFGNILAIEAKNTRGIPLRICITNKLSRRCDIYTALDFGNTWKTYYFMIPPQPSGDAGYSVHFNSISIGSDITQNEVRLAHLIQIPYYRIQNLSLAKNPTDTEFSNALEVTRVDKVNPVEFIASFTVRNAIDPKLLMLTQAYEPGWKAYEVKDKNFITTLFPFFFGKDINGHILVNNWANGWMINRDLTGGFIIIVFLPQYLQYAGFILLLGFVGLLAVMGLKSKIKRHHRS